MDLTDTIVTAAATVTAVLVLAAAAWATARFVRRVMHFLDDWQGEEERPGVPRRPGIPERLAVVEARTEQLQRNGGASLADVVDRIEALVRDRIEQHVDTPVQAGRAGSGG